MSGSEIPFLDGLLGGQRQDLGARILRTAMRCAEPFYTAVVRGRNRLYRSGILHTHRLNVPVISVGNITAGGTGKTPMVRWLAARLRAAGMHPAVLLRGYKRNRQQISDEETLLRECLQADSPSPVIVHAQADRVAGGQQVLREHPEVDVLILDDGFQHRRLARNFDLVLIDACRPFGYGHVHPRGLLREPLKELARADAFILTRSDQIAPAERRDIEQTLREHNHIAPVYAAVHALTGLRPAAPAASSPTDLPLEALASRRFYAFAGIGSPQSLHRQLAALPGEYRGHYWFDDHHDYIEDDLREMRRRALAVGAEVLLITEKDWTKLRHIPQACSDELPLWRLQLQIQLEPRAEAGLISLIQARMETTAQ